jgi:hypothetical protein
MPRLEVTQTRSIRASIRLTDSSAIRVDHYAAFIHASADDVVERALAYVFSKDRDFQEFLRTPESWWIAPTLRVRHTPASEATEAPSEPASKAAIAREMKA